MCVWRFEANGGIEMKMCERICLSWQCATTYQHIHWYQHEITHLMAYLFSCILNAICSLPISMCQIPVPLLKILMTKCTMLALLLLLQLSNNQWEWIMTPRSNIMNQIHLYDFPLLFSSFFHCFILHSTFRSISYSLYHLLCDCNYN